jgi:CheY-like chemotaxis protein/HPt (histidine-containing phosphotransfer) domain-containing protein
MMDPQALLEEFRTEALEHIRAFEGELLKLERAPSDRQAVRRMFLAMHTIKGGAAMLERVELRDLSHVMEDVLGAVRDGERRFDRSTADLLLRGADLVRALVLGGDAESFRGAIAALETELREPVAPQIDLAAAALPPSNPKTETPDRPRALVVDDSPVVRMIEAALLEQAGYEAEAVADGQEALRLLEQGSYALLVSGIEMRGLGGLDLARAVRASGAHPEVAIILVTGGDESRTRDEAAAAGVTALLQKGQEGQQQLLEVARTLRAGNAT